MMLSKMYGHARPLIDADYLRIGKDLIHPYDPARVQPASYDVTLGPKLLRPKMPEPHAGLPGLPSWRAVDLRKTKPAALMTEHKIGDSYFLEPGGCALVSTAEQVNCPPDMIASVDGKSTIGRCFLAVHVTAGFIDPGYVGTVTLELVNHSPWAFVLYEGMKIGQLRFSWLNVMAERPYGSPGLGSHYQGSLAVRAAEPLEQPVTAPKKGSYCEGCE